MDDTKQESSLMQEFQDTTISKLNVMKYIGLFFIVIVLGVGSGFMLTKVIGSSSTTQTNTPSSSAPKGATYGTNDTRAFPDTAEGILRIGGIDGEGAFHLERPGGESQNVYLTSSVVDLSQLVGKKIKVWGQTQAGQKAGWLMDVGRIEVL